MSTTRDKEPHKITVERVNEDDGEIDWLIEHNNSCQKEIFEGVEFYTCAVQSELDYAGLEDLAGLLDLDSVYKIPIGEYEIIGVIAFDPYSREGEVWFEKFER